MKSIYQFFKKGVKWLISRLRRNYNKFRFFILPNWYANYQGRIKLKGGIPICGQRLCITGNGTVEIGQNCSFGAKLGGFNKYGTVEIQPRKKNAKIQIGSNVLTNNNVFICSANYIEIGNDTLIGQNVTIMDYDAHCIEPQNRKMMGEVGKVIIGKNTWIGNNVSILKNVVLGENVIIGTGAVVTKSFPSNVIIGGVPAKIIKHI